MRKTWIRRALLGGALGMLALPICAVRADDDETAAQDEQTKEQRVVFRAVVDEGSAAEAKSAEEVHIEKIRAVVEGTQSGEQKIFVVGDDDKGSGEHQIFVVGQDGEDGGQKQLRFHVQVDGDNEDKPAAVRVLRADGGEQKQFRVLVRGDSEVEKEGVFVVRERVSEDDDDSSASDRNVRIRVRRQDDEEDHDVHVEHLHRILKQIHVDGDGSKRIRVVVIGDDDDSEGASSEGAAIWKSSDGHEFKFSGDGHGVIMLQNRDGEDSPIKVQLMHLGNNKTTGELHQIHGDHGVFKFDEGGQVGPGVYRFEFRRKDEHGHDEDHEIELHEFESHEHGDHDHAHDGDHEHTDIQRAGRVIRLDGNIDRGTLKELLGNREIPEEVRELLKQHMGENGRLHLELRGDREGNQEENTFRLRRLHDEEHELNIDRNVEVELELAEEAVENRVRLQRELKPRVVDELIRWHQAEDDDDDNDEDVDDRLEELEDRLIRLERKIDQLLRQRR